jgi:hypothetical protein
MGLRARTDGRRQVDALRRPVYRLALNQRQSPQFSSFDNCLQRGGVDVVELVSALPFGPYETDRLQHVEVLRDRLAGQSQAVLHRQSGASEYFEDLGHGRDYRQVTACLSRRGHSLIVSSFVAAHLLPQTVRA